MRCQVLDHTGAVQCQAVLHEFIHAKNGTEWAMLTETKHGRLFYATVDRIRDINGKELDHHLVPASSAATDEEFVNTVMEFLASGAKSIEHFHYMDKAHSRRVHPNPAWFKK